MSTEQSPPSTDIKTRFDFAARVHVYTHDYIRFADTKASALLAACGFIFSGLLTRADAIGEAIRKAPNICCLIYMLGFVGIAALIFTVGHCVACVMPRLGSVGNGLVYWDQIARETDYAQQVGDLTSEEAIKQLATHIAAVSGIAKKKYLHVHWAIWGFCVTLVTALILSLIFIAISAQVSSPK